MITICIPTFKRPTLLQQALATAIVQPATVVSDIIVVDNDCDSREVEVAMQRFSSDGRIRYLRNDSNLGMFGNWNRCLDLVQTSHFSILSDDDLLLPTFAPVMAEAIRIWPNAVLIGGRAEVFDERTVSWRYHSWLAKTRAAARSLLLPSHWMLGSNHLAFANYFGGATGVVIRTDVARTSGGFDATWYPVSDWEFWYRLSSKGQCIVLERTLGRYRTSVNASLDARTVANHILKSATLRKRMASDIDAHLTVLERATIHFSSKADDLLPTTLDGSRLLPSRPLYSIAVWFLSRLLKALSIRMCRPLPPSAHRVGETAGS